MAREQLTRRAEHLAGIFPCRGTSSGMDALGGWADILYYGGPHR